MSKSRKPQTFGDLAPSKWPGERLGLPETGQLSIARIGRRIVAILIDWGIAMLLTLPYQQALASHVQSLVTLAIFALMQCLFIPTIGGSIGHRVMGLRIIKLGGGWVGFWRPAVRTLLLVLVIPVLVWDSDQRAFHDKVAGTALVRM